MITSETYQALEQRMSEIYFNQQEGQVKARGYSALTCYEKFEYVVCDECHYFLADSNYNTNTEVSFRWIQDTFNSKVRIFMSATIDEFRKLVDKDDHDREYNRSNFYQIKFRTLSGLSFINQRNCVYEYSIQRNYDYVNVHTIEKRDDVANIVLDGGNKWLIFVDSIPYGKRLEKELKERLKEKDESVVMITSDYRREEDGTEAVEEITKENKFTAKILIATSVLDNGINIKDLELRNIVLFADTEVEFVQMLGRKRKDGGKTDLYIYKMPKEHFQQRMAMTERVWRLALKYQKNFGSLRNWGLKEDNIDINWFNEMESKEIMIQHCRIMNMLANGNLSCEDIRKVFRAESGCLILSLLAFTHLENLRTIYGDIIRRFDEDGEDAFLKEQLRWLGKSDLEARMIIEDSKRSQLDQARETVIDEMRKQLEIQMNSGEAKEFKRKIMQELVTLAKMALCEETEREKAKRSFERCDRPISKQMMKFLNQYCDIPYKLEEKDGIYMIKEK